MKLFQTLRKEVIWLSFLAESLEDAEIRPPNRYSDTFHCKMPKSSPQVAECPRVDLLMFFFQSSFRYARFFVQICSFFCEQNGDEPIVNHTYILSGVLPIFNFSECELHATKRLSVQTILKKIDPFFLSFFFFFFFFLSSHL